VIDHNEILLGSDVHEGQWIGRLAVISCRIERMRHNVTDHAVIHFFHESFGEFLFDDCSKLFDDFLSVGRQFFQVLSDGFAFGLHDYITYESLFLAHSWRLMSNLTSFFTFSKNLNLSFSETKGTLQN